MREAKGSRVTFNIEPSYRGRLDTLAERMSTTTSEYVRALVIADLHKRGLLSTEALMRATIGNMSVEAAIG